MAVSHMVDSEKGILHVIREGRVSAEDETAALRSRLQDPAVTYGIPTLVDCRYLTTADSEEMVRHLAETAMLNSPPPLSGPTAILAPGKTERAMMALYAALVHRTHPHTKVFRRYEDAREWLDTMRNYTRSHPLTAG